MITLTVPPSVASVLGGVAPANYEKLVISPMTLNASKSTIQAEVQLSSTSNAEMPTISGTLTINAVSGALAIQVQQLDFYRTKTLSQGQKNTVLGIIATAQDDLESGLITIGLIDGTHSAGT